MEILPSLVVHFNFGQQAGYCFKRSSSVLKGSQLSATWQREQLKERRSRRYTFQNYRSERSNQSAKLNYLLYHMQDIIITTVNFDTLPIRLIRLIELNSLVLLLPKAHVRVHQNTKFQDNHIKSFHLLTITFGIPNVAFIGETTTYQNNRDYDQSFHYKS